MTVVRQVQCATNVNSTFLSCHQTLFTNTCSRPLPQYALSAQDIVSCRIPSSGGCHLLLTPAYLLQIPNPCPHGPSLHGNSLNNIIPLTLSRSCNYALPSIPTAPDHPPNSWAAAANYDTVIVRLAVLIIKDVSAHAYRYLFSDPALLTARRPPQPPHPASHCSSPLLPSGMRCIPRS